MIWCPFADEAEARQISTRLLDEGLIACANILPPMTSIFRWNGEASESQEVGVLMKTGAARLEDAIARLAELHSYDSPAIMGWHVDVTTPDTQSWLGQITGMGSQG